MPLAAEYRSWGGLQATPTHVHAPLRQADASPTDGHWLAYGNGRSYGDTCLTSSGALIDTRGLNRILSFDQVSGRLRGESGVLLGDVIRHVAGSGWFPAVVPGTQHVTLAGAVANDIHGKNHHRRGTFGCHVTELLLMLSDGTRLTLSPRENPELFQATIGGMGLTGLILEVEIALMPAASQDIIQEAIPLESLADFFRLAPEREARHEYVVAWLDSLATGGALGRGVLFCGDHAEGGCAAGLPVNARLSVPVTPPVSLLNQPALRIFNWLYRRKALARPGPSKVATAPFFFPLDVIGQWNRLYGPRGLRQHQCVVPLANAEQVVRAMLEQSQRAGHGSLLTVIKLFGAIPSPGLLSFPRPGVTLTLDFAYRGAPTDALLAQLDRLVLDAGGRMNPYKDARMTRDVFEASFPEQAAFRPWRDTGAASDFSRRVGLTDSGSA